MTLQGAPERTQLSERAVFLVVGAVILGVYLPHEIPVLPFVVLVLIALVLRRPVVFCVALVFLASGLSFNSHQGLQSDRSGAVDAWVKLVGDPKPIGGGVRVDVRLDSKRYELVGFGWSGSRLSQAEMGDLVHIRGVVGSGSGSPSWKWRHVVGKIQLRWIGEIEPASGLIGLSNALRHTLSRGVGGLPVRDRSLILGFVIGDDREQSQELKQAFRDSGLTHLLAVSGQNVAFVLAVLAPLLGRLERRVGIAVVIVALALFGTMTRWEPSVLRATVMVGSATMASFAGRRVSGTRSLSLAVAFLLLIDPLLLWSVGFALSVGASAGILGFSASIEQHLRGPHWLRSTLAITTAAQIGVSPLLVWIFDGVPLAAIPANLMAGPAAGPVMVWGLTAGLLAGLVGGFWAEVIHFPTRLAVSWVAIVAESWSNLELPVLGSRGVLVCGCLAILIVLHRKRIASVAVTALE